jgi:tetratricopeptide (TPR) repeat protein
MIIMTGEICFQMTEFRTAFFFFAHAVLACNYTKNWGIKTEALCYLGKISMDINQYQKAIIFFKKALQYAWKTKDNES